MRKLLTILLLFPFSLFATKYYIDPTGVDNAGRSGGIGQEWATLSYACTRVSSPDTIYVNAGTYAESANCNLAVGVSIMGAGVTSHINFTHASTDYTDASIRLVSTGENTAGNQSISYLYLDGNSQASYHGVYVSLRGNVKIHHCTFINFRYNAVHFRNKLGGYEYDERPTVFATGNELYNCIITNCSEIDYDFGLFPTHGHGNIRIAGQKDIKIYNDTITQTGGAEGYNANIVDGLEGNNQGLKYYNNVSYKPVTNGGNWNFHIEHWDALGGFEVYDNEFYNGDCAFDLGGYHNTIYYPGNYDTTFSFHDNLVALDALQPWGTYYQAVGLEALCEDVYIYNNHFKNFPWVISSAIQTNPAYHQERIYIYYNIFENCGWTNYQWGGAIKFNSQISGAEYNDWYIYNNVFQATTSYSSNAGIFFELSGPANNINIKNNIFVEHDWAIIFVSTRNETVGQIDTLTLQYNCLYNNGSSNGIRYSGGESITHLISSNNVIDNPDFNDFVNPVDTFDLQAASPCVDAGIGVGLTLDYDGNIIGANPDIGAYEYGAIPPDIPPDLPTVETNSALAVIYTRLASGGGNVTDNGGGSVYSRGLCWSTSANPTITDNAISLGSGLGAFTGFLNGLTAGTTYHIRSWAINPTGVSYGADYAFTTPQKSIAKTDGKIYKTGNKILILH